MSQSRNFLRINKPNDVLLIFMEVKLKIIPKELIFRTGKKNIDFQNIVPCEFSIPK